jgi:hypothetical protein
MDKYIVKYVSITAKQENRHWRLKCLANTGSLNTRSIRPIPTQCGIHVSHLSAAEAVWMDRPWSTVDHDLAMNGTGGTINTPLIAERIDDGDRTTRV